MILFRPFESNSVKLRLISTEPKYVKPLKVPPANNCGGSVIRCSHLFFMPDFSFDARFHSFVPFFSLYFTVSVLNGLKSH